MPFRRTTANNDFHVEQQLRYKLRVESDLLGMTHKCVVEAADLETFKSKLCRTIGIIYGQVQEDLVFSVWLPDSEDFALITDLSMLGDKSRVRVSSRAGGGAAAPAAALLSPCGRIVRPTTRRFCPV